MEAKMIVCESRSVLARFLPLLCSVAILAGANCYPIEELHAQDASTSFEELARRATAARQEDRGEEAIDLYGQALSIRPAWGEGWWYLGVLHYEKNRYAEARKAFRTITSIEPGMGTGWLLLGLCQFEMQDYYAALGSISQAISVGIAGDAELFVRARLTKALLLTRNEEFEEAFNLLYPLARDHSSNPKVIEAMGVCVLRLPFMPHELPEEYREVVLKAGQAFTHAALEDGVQANEAFRKAIKEHPNTPNLHYAYGQFLRVRNSDRAIVEFEEELKISPDHIPARLQIAWYFLTRGEAERALAPAKDALAFNFDSAAAKHVLGRAYLALGDFDKAIPELEAVVRSVPGSIEVRNVLAQAYYQAGRQEDATQQLLEIKRLNSARQEAERNLIGSNPIPGPRR